jgi:hypothetical protein
MLYPIPIALKSNFRCSGDYNHHSSQFDSSFLERPEVLFKRPTGNETKHTRQLAKQRLRNKDMNDVGTNRYVNRNVAGLSKMSVPCGLQITKQKALLDAVQNTFQVISSP